MRYYFIILATIFYILNSVEGRNLHQSEENNEKQDESETEHVINRRGRYSRNRRHSYYKNYQDSFVRNFELDDYLEDMSYFVKDISTSLKYLAIKNQYNPFSYGRRDYTCDCDGSIRKILDVVEELAMRAKYTTSPPPPQLIYIPYIVHEKTKGNPEKNVTFNERFGPTDDINSIRFDLPKETLVNSKEEDDYVRPVHFKPISPKVSTVEPLPEGKINTTTSSPLAKPGKCEGAILSCCGNVDIEKCFTSYNCLQTYKTGKACDSQVIKKVLEIFSKAYGPQ